MDEERIEKYVNDMKIREKSDKFLGVLNRFFTNKSKDDQIIDCTTQALYYSLAAKKKRLDQSSLTMNTYIEPVGYSNEVKSIQQGKQAVDCNIMKTRTTREFFYQGKRIYKSKNNEIVRINFLKSEVDGKVECPNCGYVGEISSFKNGCDQCGSKFEVKEFEPKVSTFTQNLDVEKHVGKITRFVNAASIGLVAFMWIGIFLGFFILADLELTGVYQKIGETMIQLGGYLLFPMIRFALIMCLIYFVMGTLFELKHSNNIVNASKVEEAIDDFSVQDFYQDLEMRLNQIFVTNDVKEVEAFAECDLSEIVNNHLDIVDSHMNRLEFIDVRDGDDCFIINVKANMSLYRFVNGKIKHIKKCITLDVKHSIYGKSMTFIKAYSCSHCGNTIDIMKGGVCEHCGNELSIEDIGIKIKSMNIEKVKDNLVFSYVIRCLTVFVLAMSLNMIIPSITTELKPPVQIIINLFKSL